MLIWNLCETDFDVESVVRLVDDVESVVRLVDDVDFVVYWLLMMNIL